VARILSQEHILLKLTAALPEGNTAGLQALLEEVLADLAMYTSSQRAFVFYSAGPDSDLYQVVEYHQSGEPMLNLHKISSTDFMIWGKFKPRHPFFYISNIKGIPDSYPHDASLFARSGCTAFAQQAMMKDQNITGFLAFLNNSDSHQWDDSMQKFLVIVAELFRLLLEKIIGNVVSGKIKIKTTHDLKVELLEKLWANLPYGIALYDTRPACFLHTNPTFKSFFGIEEYTGKEAKEVFKILRNNGYDTGNIVFLNGKLKESEFTLYHLNRVLRGTVSKIPDTTLLLFNVSDISTIDEMEKSRKSFNRQLTTLNEAAIHFVSPSVDEQVLFRLIGDTAFDLLQNAVVMVNEYLPGEGHLKTVYVKGFGFSMEVIAKLMGRHPLNKTYPLDVNTEAYRQIISARIKEIPDGLTAIALGVLPAPAAKRIEKIVNVQRFFICGLFDGDNLYGTIIFLMRPETHVNISLLETFSRMASSALYAQHMRQKLHKTTTVLQDAVNIAKIGYWEYDLNSDIIKLSTGLAMKMEPGFMPAPGEDSVTIRIEDFISRFIKGADIDKINQMIDQARNSSHQSGFVTHLEFTLHLPSGRFLYVLTRAEMRQPGRLTGVAQDLTAMKKVEDELMESDLKFRKLVEQSTDAIIVVKDSGEITEWNPVAEKLTGLSAQQVLGQPAWEIESTIMSTRSQGSRQNSFRMQKIKNRFLRFFHPRFSHRPFTHEICIRDNNDQLVHLVVNNFVFSAGNNRFLCRIAVDITREKMKMQQEKEKEILLKTAKAKDLFLENMSHELRTPLNGIIGMSENLMNTSMDELQQEMLQVLKESSDSLLEIISAIHELSRLETDMVIIRPEPFSLSAMMDKTIRIFSAAAMHKNITLQLTDLSPSGITLTGDEFRLRQAIGNVLGNAVKFTPAGGQVQVTVNAHRLNLMDMEVVIEVKDTGIGIEEDKIPSLFTKFTQIDSSYTRQYEGMGIGLSISRELLKLMGGEIAVESEPGRGSIFRIKVVLPYIDLKIK
jgi:signal transduction histidine kinase